LGRSAELCSSYALDKMVSRRPGCHAGPSSSRRAVALGPGRGRDRATVGEHVDDGRDPHPLRDRGRATGRRPSKLLPLVYDELRSLAARKLARRSPARRSRPRPWFTKAYLRLVGLDAVADRPGLHPALWRAFSTRIRRMASAAARGNVPGCSSSRRRRADQPQVGFVNQGRGLERLAGLLPRQLPGRQAAQLVVDQWQQLLGRLPVALLDRGEDVGHVRHRHAHRRSPRSRPARARARRLGERTTGRHDSRDDATPSYPEHTDEHSSADRPKAAGRQVGRFGSHSPSELRGSPGIESHEDDISRNLMHSTNASWNRGPQPVRRARGVRGRRRGSGCGGGEIEGAPGAAEGGVAREVGRSAWRARADAAGARCPRTKFA